MKILGGIEFNQNNGKTQIVIHDEIENIKSKKKKERKKWQANWLVLLLAQQIKNQGEYRIKTCGKYLEWRKINVLETTVKWY